SPDSAIKNLKKAENIQISDELNAFLYYITPESKGESIEKLQRLFIHMGISSNLRVDGNYNSVKNDLIKYQIEKNIIENSQDEQAGYFGNRTKKALRDDLVNFDEEKSIQNKLNIIKNHAENNVGKLIDYIGNVDFGQTSNKIKIMQQSLLITDNSLTITPSGSFGDKTKQALISYQIKNGIIENNESIGAGLFGPKTKAQLKKDIISIYEKKLIKDNNLN
ncbi:MAG: hypothetical protein NWP80_00760, partial [Candidatus Gracilibacteria bacterium]|nr:hypothetical protein [Candidatus Gracilibacteria bacterium]